MSEVVKFPTEIDADENARQQIMKEAERLSRLSESDRAYQLRKSAERLSIPLNQLKPMVEAFLKERKAEAKAVEAADRRREKEREQVAKLDAKREAKRIKEDEKQAKLEQKRIDKQEKDKLSAFATISRFPRAQQTAKLVELAERLGEDAETLKLEFQQYISIDSSSGTQPSKWNVELWGDPVTTATVLRELIEKISSHVVARPDEVLTMALWVLLAWVHEVADLYHSPYLVATSVDPGSGKTQMLNVLGYLVPKPWLVGEVTGPSIYRFVDAEKPTLIVDNADDLFARKSDVKNIFEMAWTRGYTVPRAVKLPGGRYIIVEFDPFSPKMVGLIGSNVPKALVTRCIAIEMQPKRLDEKITHFGYKDDEVFSQLRRKLARWAADNGEALKHPEPTFPKTFNNRVQENWRLVLAIAELAKGNFPKAARAAGERLARTWNKPSWGGQLLTAMQPMLARRKDIPSVEVVTALLSDPDGPWVEYEYKKNNPITQRQVAHLLARYHIYPRSIGRQRIKGYIAKDFADAFARYVDTSARPLGER